jgi:hypothetical protein
MAQRLRSCEHDDPHHSDRLSDGDSRFLTMVVTKTGAEGEAQGTRLDFGRLITSSAACAASNAAFKAADWTSRA